MSFEEHGFALCYNYLPLEPIDDIVNDIGALFARQQRWAAGPSWTLSEDMRSLLKRDVPRYIATARETQNLPSVHRLLSSKRIISLAQRFGVKAPVIGAKASVHIMADNLVVPGGYHRAPPHQEWRALQGSLDSLVIWIPLGHVHGNGLEVIPGSHLYGLVPTQPHPMTPEVVNPEMFGKWESLYLDVGDAVAFSSFLIHRTAVGPGLRIAISIRFNNAAESTFIDRGYPTPYKTIYSTDLITPDFPPKTA